MNIEEFVILLIAFCLCLMGITLVIVSSGWDIPQSESAKTTYEKCCGGNMCSDTYYDAEKDVCILSLCEQNLFQDKVNCEYKPTR